MVVPIFSFTLSAVNISAKEGRMLAVRVDAHPLYPLGVLALQFIWESELEPSQHGLKMGIVADGLLTLHR